MPKNKLRDPKQSKITQKVVVITGAANGLGLALTKLCLERGMSVVMSDIDEPLLFERFQELKENNPSVIAVGCDVSQPESVKRLAEKTKQTFNRVDWLFNNAGISGPLAPLWEISQETIQKVISVNLQGVINGIQTFMPFLFQQDHRSQIINIASVYGLCSGSLVAAYAMTKHAIVALSESLYFDLQRLEKPVDVSVACPSFSNTALLKNAVATTNNVFNQKLINLLEKARPVEDLALHIIDQVEKKQFYILPDREVKEYFKQRMQSIIEQENPYKHSLEKIIAAISKI